MIEWGNIIEDKQSMKKEEEGLEELATHSVIGIAISGSKRSENVVKWALEKFVPQGQQVCFKFLHVRPVISWIPTPMGKYISISDVQDEVAAAYRKEDDQHVNEKLRPFMKMCCKRQVQVEVLKIESDGVERAIAREIREKKICKLVIGTSSRSIFSRGPTLSSKISQSCPRFCTVYAVSKGKLSCIRASNSESDISIRDEPSINTSCSSDNSSSHYLSSTTEWTDRGLDGSFSRFRSSSLPARRVQVLSTVNENLLHKRTPSNIFSKLSSSISLAGTSEDQSHINFELEKLRVELRHIRGMYAMAQGEAIDASRKLSDLHKRRLEEETFFELISIKEQEAEELARQGNKRYEAAKKEADFIHHCANKEAAERKYAESKALRKEKEKEKLESALAGCSDKYQIFTWEEIVSATESFSESLKIGNGTYGTVYKGSFRHTVAAVKVLCADGIGRNKQFQQELEILSRICHPHVLILLGACPDHACLVYEFMDNGSLEDRIFRKNDTPPLIWYDRYRIAREVASALAFLHNCRPQSIIHRDLKPGNILLDRNFVSKIGDVGLSTMVNEEPLSESTNNTDIVGTLCYIDPEYQRTGIISPESDIYALGMVILQLLTAKRAVGLAHVVEKAMESDRLFEILDPKAGEWPIEETKRLSSMALKCMELRSKDRPRLKDEVLPFLEKLNEVSEKARDLAFDNSPSPPKHFVCPILKEVMKDPCVAADGYTYERKGIDEWLRENDTSPMTNLFLPNKFLTPNYTLLCAIFDWKSGKQ